MPENLLTNNKGIALLVTLAVITILVTVSLELNRSARSSVVSSASIRDRMTLTHMATSGIQAGMALLARDKTESSADFLQENWADAEKIAAVLKEIPFETGDLTLTIHDEMGKIQVNALVTYPKGREFNPLQESLWFRLLEYGIPRELYTEDIRPGAIINSLKDWLDSGDDDAVTGLSGAESDYYLGLDPAYPCANGPLNHLSELLRVKGMTAPLIDGQNEENRLSQHLTVHGMTDIGGNTFTFKGSVNINTADLAVLEALFPAEGKDLARAFYEYRQETEDLASLHDLNNAAWYKEVPGLGEIDINPELIRTDSDIFRLEAVATRQNMDMTAVAVVERVKDPESGRWRCQILNWQIK